jgi:hypothetical protein
VDPQLGWAWLIVVLFLHKTRKKTKKTTPHQRVGWDAQAKVHLSEIAANETQFWFFFGGVFAGFFFLDTLLKEKRNQTRQNKENKQNESVFDFFLVF